MNSASHTTDAKPSETSKTWENDHRPLHLAGLTGPWQLDTAAGFIHVPARHLTLPSAFVESTLRWGAPVTRFGLTLAIGALHGTNTTNSGRRSGTHSDLNGESESEEPESEEPESEEPESERSTN